MIEDKVIPVFKEAPRHEDMAERRYSSMPS
jgi:hypothetical protein